MPEYPGVGGLNITQMGDHMTDLMRYFIVLLKIIWPVGCGIVAIAMYNSFELTLSEWRTYTLFTILLVGAVVPPCIIYFVSDDD